MSADHPFATLVRQCVTGVTGRPTPTIGMSFTTDARFVRNQGGIPAVVCGPGDIAQAHGIDEWAAVSQLVEATAAYADLYRSFGAEPGAALHCNTFDRAFSTGPSGRRAGQRLPRQPGRHSLGRLAVTATEPMVPTLQPSHRYRPGNGGQSRFQLRRRGKSVGRTGHEQARHVEGPEVLGAQPVGPAGGVQRVANQHQAGGRHPCRHGHRADAPAHGPSAHENPPRGNAGLVGQRPRLPYHGGYEDIRSVRSTPARQPVRKIDPAHCRAEGGNRVVDGHQPRLVPAGRRSRGEQ